MGSLSGMMNTGGDESGSHGGGTVGQRCYHLGQRWSVGTRFESRGVNGFEVFNGGSEKGNKFALHSERGKCLAKTILFNLRVT